MYSVSKLRPYYTGQILLYNSQNISDWYCMCKDDYLCPFLFEMFLIYKISESTQNAEAKPECTKIFKFNK